MGNSKAFQGPSHFLNSKWVRKLPVASGSHLAPACGLGFLGLPGPPCIVHDWSMGGEWM